MIDPAQVVSGSVWQAAHRCVLIQWLFADTWVIFSDFDKTPMTPLAARNGSPLRSHDDVVAFLILEHAVELCPACAFMGETCEGCRYANSREKARVEA